MLMTRIAKVHRKTNETNISVSLNIDGTGKVEIDTGIGFLDHMLHHIAVHGLFDLDVSASGDLYVDAHHTIEDVAIVLGQAFYEALGDKKGIVRSAHAYMPMDETLALVAIDLSGRPFSYVDVEWNTPMVGVIPTSMFEHFFESFAVNSHSNLHAHVMYGRDDHHKAEALFKALARALDAATKIDPRRVGIPSTKGTLTA
jgi:imidazoleglycerol-phosphate dehydratase